VLRVKRPDAERPFRVPLYPITPLFFVVVSTWFVLMTLFTKPAQAFAGLVFLLLGVPVYFYWKRRAAGEAGRIVAPRR